MGTGQWAGPAGGRKANRNVGNRGVRFMLVKSYCTVFSVPYLLSSVPVSHGKLENATSLP